jgi:hypothetical protein
MRLIQVLLVVALLAMVLSVVSPGVSGVSTVLSGSGSPPTASPLASPAVTGYSYNWAGYVSNSSANSVTAVSGTWVQPTITCGSGSTYLATWVGIDGFASSDLVQTGTGAQCVGGTASYNAWWEVLPAAETLIPSITVHAGDTITASVTYSATTHKFSMKIADGASSFTKTQKVSKAARASAECIVERPEVGGSFSTLAKFKTDAFSSCTATVSGVTGGIGSFSSVFLLDMVNNSDTKIIAVTSALKSNTSFSVKYK